MKREKQLCKSKTGYLLGCIALTISAMILLPKIIEWGSSKIYSSTPKVVRDDDDWGPVIVRNNANSEVQNNG